MNEFAEDLPRQRFPWARTRFDMLGVAGAVAAWMVGVVLSLLWAPLFWIGFVAIIVILLATRFNLRTPPGDPEAILAPVDGVLVSIEEAAPPPELRLEGGSYQRLRVASAPTSTNLVYAPLAGEVTSVVEEAGEPSLVFASAADTAGLAECYLAFAGGGDRIGLRLATGGFGPRLDVDVEAGDPVRPGRAVATRRLGGWCDIWLPAECGLAVWPGMTLKAAETRLVTQMAPSESDVSPLTDVMESDPVDEDEAVPFEMPPSDEDTPESEEGATTDPAEMFEKLRETVEKTSKPKARRKTKPKSS